MIIVLADDITGAAEIAGLAFSRGLSTSLIVATSAISFSIADVVIVATDTRSMSSADAKHTVEEFCRSVTAFIYSSNAPHAILFKKTDSVLRGHIALELSTIMDCLDYDNALLVAQNPSKQRIIDNGIYYVDGNKLSETMFACDPEYPAYTSHAAELLGGNVESLSVDSRIPNVAKTIFVADASTSQQVTEQVRKAASCTLVAGGADCFNAFLDIQYGVAPLNRTTPVCGIGQLRGKLLAVCGSTQGGSILDTPFMTRHKTVEVNMPDDVFEGAPAESWINSVAKQYLQSDCCILRIGQHAIKGAEYALRLKGIMADAVAGIISQAQPEYIIIEGGATAFAVLTRLELSAFNIESEFSPGVVGMRHGDTHVVLKPGSYPWGNLFS